MTDEPRWSKTFPEPAVEGGEPTPEERCERLAEQWANAEARIRELEARLQVYECGKCGFSKLACPKMICNCSGAGD